ncbi:Tubby C-terminal-like domain [Plasmopara halstedii]|uniref:Tubby C-terminal-like domain n=1 Tax=Plasmopara halstedii TaxID=4781 RepID=A0A0P1ATW8_PLAHL|nr:Tubby C-terminal-like domain [Plasmopara halstedii]CEG44132.1 Tubby C-terminal-like domain [Plasmopara halstedii]|eukprot:XP_024580501.1 Tubby C-terminal-like domain [Plasmopara halstedii]
MGIAFSMKKFLATPLKAQWRFPFVVNPRFCRRRVTTLVLTNSFWSHAIEIHGYGVCEANSDRILFRVVPTVDGIVSDGCTKWLVDEYGIAVAHLRPRDHSSAALYDVCLGKRLSLQTKVLTTLVIKFVAGRGDPLIAEVVDQVTGCKSRIGCHGIWRQRAAVLYLEKGCGGRREAIAKVYRPTTNRLSKFLDPFYHVEIAIGVDVALVLLICAAMDDASMHKSKVHRYPLLGTH